MLETLIASKPSGKRLSKRGWIVSVAVHSALLIALITVAGPSIMPMLEKPKEQHVVFTEIKQPPPPKVEPAPEKVHVAPKPPPPAKRAAPVYRAPVVKAPAKVALAAVPAPVKISIVVPVPEVSTGDVTVKVADVAVTAPPASAGAAGKGTSSSDAGKEGGTGDSNGGGQPFSGDQVEQEVKPISMGSMAYPESMRTTGLQGVVSVQFVVGANGRVEPGSFQVATSTNEAFTQVVKRALLAARYRPAQIGGKAVRQLVEQSFTFKLDK